MTYIGRFAPSPSGSLHFGSLVAALGSYLQARSQRGKWLVRIEDIDPPREVKGSADDILRTIEAFGLHWDDSVLYQHTRYEAYQAQIESWLAQGEAYLCECTRQAIQKSGGIYQGTCLSQQDRLKLARSQNPAQSFAVRVKIDRPITAFHDLKHGMIKLDPLMAAEDFIIKRRDGLFAYNLAVVLDDIYQGVTEIVRGADLIEPTGRQVSLYHKLGAKPVQYLHLPLALNQQGGKLSKQNHALAVDKHHPLPTLKAALAFLGLPLPDDMQGADLSTVLAWAIQHWHVSRLPNQRTILTNY